MPGATAANAPTRGHHHDWGDRTLTERAASFGQHANHAGMCRRRPTFSRVHRSSKLYIIFISGKLIASRAYSARDPNLLKAPHPFPPNRARIILRGSPEAARFHRARVISVDSVGSTAF